MSEQRIYNFSGKHKVRHGKEQLPGHKSNTLYTAFEPVEEKKDGIDEN